MGLSAGTGGIRPSTARGVTEHGRELYDLRGRVVFPDRAPVPGATVALLGRPADAPRIPPVQRFAVADATGEFVFERQLAGEYLLEAHHEDAVSQTAKVALSARTEPVTLVLVPAATLTVRVVAESDERPIPGARVRVGMGDQQFGETDVFREGTTDAAGQAVFRGVLPTANHIVYVDAPGFVDGQVNVLAFEHPRRERWEVTVALLAAARVSGRVVDARGRGLPGATVGWQLGATPRPRDTPDLFDPFPFHGRSGAVTTDAHGRFTLAAEPGPGCVIAIHPRHELGQTCGLTAELGREVAGVEVVLLDGARISGIVVDPSGAPVGGADVIVTKRGWQHMPMFSDSYRFHAVTGADGRFEFTGVKRVALALTAWTPERSSDLLEIDMTQTSEMTDVRLVLEYNGEITGEVVEESGEPVAGAPVEHWAELTLEVPRGVGGGKGGRVQELLEHKNRALPRASGTTLTDLEGKFRITGLPSGVYTVRASRPTRGAMPPAYTSVQDVVEVGGSVRLVLRGLGGVRGQVVDERGQPVQAYEILFAPLRPRLKRDDFDGAQPIASEDGRFVIHDLPVGEWVLAVRGRDVVETRMSRAVTIQAGQVADAGTIRVERGRSRPGLVLDAKGAPVPQARVTLSFEAPTEVYDVIADKKGAFTLPPVAAGRPLKVRAESLTASSNWLVVPPQLEKVTIALTEEAKGSVAGVLIEPGQPVDNRTMILTFVADGVPGVDLAGKYAAVTAEGGRFRFEQVAPGQYYLWCRRAQKTKVEGGDAWARYEKPISVTALKETAIVFRPPPASVEPERGKAPPVDIVPTDSVREMMP